MYLYELTPEEITLETIDGVQYVNGQPVLNTTSEPDPLYVNARSIHQNKE